MAEQKVIHYQTLEEADATIAMVARSMNYCPILSSDSDFFIYPSTMPVSLKSLKFSLKQTKSSEKDGPKGDKVWALEGEYVSLMNICRKEFNLQTPHMLAMAAIVIGNDSIAKGAFPQFRRHDTLKARIEHVFKWAAKQTTLEAALESLLQNVPNEGNKKLLEASIRTNLQMYRGEFCDPLIWRRLEANADVITCMKKATIENEKLLKLVEKMKITTSKTNEMKKSGPQPTKSRDTPGELAAVLATHNGQLRQIKPPRSYLPEWYKEKHVDCVLQTYLLNIVENQVVFLTPQVEMFGSPGSHNFSIPIIQVTAGILLGSTGPDPMITFESQENGKPTRFNMKPILELDGFGPVPLLKVKGEQDCNSGSDDFAITLSHETRLKLILSTLCINDAKDLKLSFYDGWPASYRIWIATLAYFLKMKLYISEDRRDPLSSLPIIISIFLCIIKNLIISPGKLTVSSSNKCLAAVNALLQATQADPAKLKKIREFYQRFEDHTLDVTTGKAPKAKAKKLSYDIFIPYTLSQYLCIVYHTEMLNNLMGNPLKSPKVRYTVNNFFIYNLSRYISEKLDASEGAIFNNVVATIVGVQEIYDVLFELITVCFQVGDLVRDVTTTTR